MTLVDQLNERVRQRVMQLRSDITQEMGKHEKYNLVKNVSQYSEPKIKNLAHFASSIGLKLDDCRALTELFSDYCRPHVWGQGMWSMKVDACMFIIRMCVELDMPDTMMAIYEQAHDDKIQDKLLDIMPDHVATALRIMR